MRKGSRTERHRRNRRRRNSSIVLAAAVIVLAALTAVIGHEGILYIRTSHADPDDPVRGVDVSSYQQEIDWDGLQDEGFAFAYVKATEGSSHQDPDFSRNWKEAHRTGMRVGAYHFLSFDSEGKSQADNFIRTVRRRFGMLPPAVDIELYGDYEYAPPTREEVHAILDPWLEAVEKKYRKKPVLYTTTYLYDQYISGDYEDYRIWISDPEVSDTLSDGRAWDFCQYSFEGGSSSVGSGGKLDLNYYSGSLWELMHLK